MADMSQPMSPDAGKPPSDGLPSDAGIPDNGNEMPNSFSVPLESFGGNPPAEGAMFKAKVVSVDQDSGTVMAEVMQGVPKRGRGIAEAAGEFESGGM